MGGYYDDAEEDRVWTHLVGHSVCDGDSVDGLIRTDLDLFKGKCNRHAVHGMIETDFEMI
jgi:hypothetical protein